MNEQNIVDWKRWMVQDIAVGSTSGVAGAVFLHLFYSVLKSEWPASYEVIRTPADGTQRESPFRYFCVRLLPVYLVALFVFATSDRLEANPLASAISFLLVELSLTSGRAALATLRSADPRKVQLVMYYATSSALVMLFAGAAYLTRHLFAPLIPKTDELPSALWTGIFAAVVAIALRNFTSENSFSDDALRRGETDAGPRLLQFARDQAVVADCDGDLIVAIIVVECSERPLWVRRLERIAGFGFRAGTYGVAQVSANHPISDEESIVELCRRFHGYYPERSNFWVRKSLLRARLDEHNDNADFIDAVESEYRRLAPSPRGASTVAARDGRAQIQVCSISQVGAKRIIKGSAFVQAGSLQLLANLEDGMSQIELINLPPSGPTPRRVYWENRDISLRATKISIAPRGVAFGGVETATVDFQYDY